MVHNPQDSIHVAAIDVGSNAVRMIVLHGSRHRGITSLSRQIFLRVPVRLGEDAFAPGQTISTQTCDELCIALKAFAVLFDIFHPVAIKSVATSALREARNQTEVLEAVYTHTGIRLDCIDGITEANYLASNYDELEADNSMSLFIDIGGGSTELSFSRKHQPFKSASFRVGTLRDLSTPQSLENIAAMRRWLIDNAPAGNHADNHADNPVKINYIASGGNVNKLVSMLSKTDALKRKDLVKFLQDHAHYNVADLAQKFNLKPDRADVILPAAILFSEIYDALDIPSISVPNLGLVDAVGRLTFLEYCQSIQS